MKISDDLLMAYADGELDASQRNEVERAIALAPELAAQVAHHQALRKQLQDAFAPMLSEPAPARLLATLRNSSTQAANDTVLAFNARQPAAKAMQKPTARTQWSWPQWSAIAASLVVGVICGMVALSTKNSEVVTARNGVLVASGSLARALTQQLSGAPDGQIQLQLSFVARSGEYCRSFMVNSQRSLAGLACRDGNEWRVPLLTSTTAAAGTYRQAGSELPVAVLRWIEAERAGDALGAAEEQRARESGWRR